MAFHALSHLKFWHGKQNYVSLFVLHLNYGCALHVGHTDRQIDYMLVVIHPVLQGFFVCYCFDIRSLLSQMSHHGFWFKKVLESPLKNALKNYIPVVIYKCLGCEVIYW